PRRAVSTLTCVHCVTILDPLGDVPVHGIQTERVCGKGVDWCRAVVVPWAAAVITVGLAFRDVVTPGVAPLAAGARGILPLRLREQPVGLAGPFREPFYVLLRLAPVHMDDGLLAAPPPFIPGSCGAASEQRAGVPFVERHLELRHRKRRPNGDLV